MSKEASIRVICEGKLSFPAPEKGRTFIYKQQNTNTTQSESNACEKFTAYKDVGPIHMAVSTMHMALIMIAMSLCTIFSNRNEVDINQSKSTIQ